tara:strand:+ start:60 stop:524 length:465 start_codon:yes stop_codon:yes gene_type:complete
MSGTDCTCKDTLAKEEVSEEELTEEEGTEETEAVSEEEEISKMDNPEELAAAITALQSVLAYMKEYQGAHGDEMMAEEETMDMTEKSESKPEVTVEAALDALKKAGIEVFAGSKQTPAAVNESPETEGEAPVGINWMEFTKSFTEIDELKKEAN